MERYLQRNLFKNELRNFLFILPVLNSLEKNCTMLSRCNIGLWRICPTMKLIGLAFERLASSRQFSKLARKRKFPRRMEEKVYSLLKERSKLKKFSLLGTSAFDLNVGGGGWNRTIRSSDTAAGSEREIKRLARVSIPKVATSRRESLSVNFKGTATRQFVTFVGDFFARLTRLMCLWPTYVWRFWSFKYSRREKM